MATYLEVKQALCRLFHGAEFADKIGISDDIVFTRFHLASNKTVEVKIPDQELTALYNLVTHSQKEGLSFLCGTKYETAVFFPPGDVARQNKQEYLCCEESEHALRFMVGTPSDEYYFYLFTLLIDNKQLYARQKPLGLSILIKILENPKSTWKTAFLCFMKWHLHDAVIIQQEGKTGSLSIGTMNALKDTYLFELRYKLSEISRCPAEFTDISEMFPPKHFIFPPSNKASIIPNQKLNRELLNFYRTAYLSPDPYVQYLSYYHILEFFYKTDYKSYLLRELRDSMNTLSSGTSDDDLHNVLSTIFDHTKGNRKLYEANEQKALFAVLSMRIGTKEIEEIKSRIDALTYKDRYKYYGTHEDVPFVEKDKNGNTKVRKIQWNDPGQILKNFADRIYPIRNGLVHSKSEMNDAVFYKPALPEHVESLKNEIPLMRAVAESIIRSTGETIEEGVSFMILKNLLFEGKQTDITIENGTITAIAPASDSTTGEDCTGYSVIPGLVDMHAHGCVGKDTMDGEFEEMCAFLAKNGTTSWLPTTMTQSYEAIKKVTEGKTDVPGTQILGFHMEGPYINAKKKGAQNGKFIRNPDLKEFKSLPGMRVVTIAPELEGSMEFIKECGALVCIGHTDADYDTCIKAIEAGANCLTHTFNAMPGIHHREPGPIPAALEKNIYVQAITDGLHLHPSIVMMLYKMFGPDRMVIISDSMRATGLGDGMYEFGGQDIEVKDGVARTMDGAIAGSTSTLWRCVKQAASFGVPFADAVRMATRTPADMIGAEKKGRIEVGADADLILLDKDCEIAKVMIAGAFFE